MKYFTFSKILLRYFKYFSNT